MELFLPDINLQAIAPEIILVVFACVILLLDAIFPRFNKTYLAFLAVVGTFFAFRSTILCWGRKEYVFREMMVIDNFSLFFNFIFLIGTALTILISVGYMNREKFGHGEYYSLILFATSGMMFMGSGVDLIMIFLGLEIMSISIYILAGFEKKNPVSNESALKYFLLGAFATGFLLYGIALLYGVTGSTKLKAISQSLYPSSGSTSPLFYIGAGLLIIGFSFKIATVPFHMWVPDVYQGAPTAITAFMSAGVKAAAFAAFFRVVQTALTSIQADLTVVLWILAVLTMTVGNVIAIAQENIKRMLAYSSIAHAGYILIALVASNEIGASGLLFYLLAYTLMNIGAFAVVIFLSKKEDEAVNLSDYAGIGFKYPVLALCMTIFMVSLSGIPPTAGFIGKFYIFSAAVKANYIGLAVIGALNSAVSVFYYFRVIVMMYMKEPVKERTELMISPSLAAAILCCALGVMLLGVFPSAALHLTRASVLFLW
ncbi:MAG: NADH-quinone oxidoreductase subunit N [Candidatus Schekmanbacteria bacterium RBG_16_38_11]|uniref:NADH-quinone oxidoreductase subunit N n=2 Tax=Candidatus Schekmaniibacteriota TaxID=1817811 RepID=A0A1F7RLU1_9BACT|nr:MAG: NADH-quinone oxidoreductase subunit N [Candidatus Schekmanbacteria bacterium GWA2_38_11]OGL44237.1 MAG: NADH-quinone oxidoreductase subunit N [Candidatus Schekmanbacteria bacterium RBG_16_38_11]